MKRSERLQCKAVDASLWAAVIFLGSVCAGVWSARVGMSSAPGGVLGLVLALAGLRAAWWSSCEARRYARLAAEEQQYECRREVRPRL
jgi:hypothetical protein